MKNLSELEQTLRKNTLLSFEEYAAIREPAYNIIINDYATKLMKKAKDEGVEITREEAEEIARKEIPTNYVPEWMTNLRISANIAGTTLCYLEGLKSSLERIEDLLRVVHEEDIDAYIDRHANDLRRDNKTE
ncbi:MAG: hypothetical protein IJY01_00465 [Clostridia bacterium]|nr:hypothetical protein [Clostridia bacterium]